MFALTCATVVDFEGKEALCPTWHVSVMMAIFDSLHHNCEAKTLAEECSRGASSFWLKAMWRQDSHQLNSGTPVGSHPARTWADKRDHVNRSCRVQEKSLRKKHLWLRKSVTANSGAFAGKPLALRSSELRHWQCCRNP